MAENPESAEPTESKKPIENPKLVFVKGGTTTQKNDELWEARYQEAEKRRNEADFERRMAQVPVEQGGAKLFTSQLTGHPEVPKAHVHLRYLTRSGEETGFECLADIIVGMDAALPTELTLILVCPRCVQGAKHMQDCQLQIRQSNKSFELVTGKGAPTFEFEETLSNGHTVKRRYKSAGVITHCEKFRCPDCDWTARIDNNAVRPD